MCDTYLLVYRYLKHTHTTNRSNKFSFFFYFAISSTSSSFFFLTTTTTHNWSIAILSSTFKQRYFILFLLLTLYLSLFLNQNSYFYSFDLRFFLVFFFLIITLFGYRRFFCAFYNTCVKKFALV